MDHVRIVLVGCGFMGRMHASVYSLLDQADLVAAVDIKPEVRESFGKDFQVPCYATLEEALEHHKVDAVDICLPTDLHREFTVKAAEARKHVMCEKPMALRVEDAKEMIDACDRFAVQLMIGHCIRFWPEYAYLKGLVESKKLGKLLSVNLTRYGGFPSWSSDNWLANPNRAGGGALDMHIHDTDYAHYLLGSPDKIVSHGTIDDRGVGQIFTTMTFGQTVAHLEGGWNLPSNAPFKMAFRAIFERGAVIFDAGPLAVFEQGCDPVVPEFGAMKASGGGNISDLGGYYHELKYFIDCLVQDLPFETVTPESSLQSLATALEEIRQTTAFWNR